MSNASQTVKIKNIKGRGIVTSQGYLQCRPGSASVSTNVQQIFMNESLIKCVSLILKS